MLRGFLRCLLVFGYVAVEALLPRGLRGPSDRGSRMGCGWLLFTWARSAARDLLLDGSWLWSHRFLGFCKSLDAQSEGVNPNLIPQFLHAEW